MMSYGGGVISGDKFNIDMRIDENALLLLMTQGNTKIFKDRVHQRLWLASLNEEKQPMIKFSNLIPSLPASISKLFVSTPEPPKTSGSFHTNHRCYYSQGCHLIDYTRSRHLLSRLFFFSQSKCLRWKMKRLNWSCWIGLQVEELQEVKIGLLDIIRVELIFVWGPNW